jgi:glutamate racemase
MKIGVFDSGVGGLSVANAIQAALPELEIMVREDSEHLPYGTRQPAEILGFVLPILNELSEAGCQIIVIACNTVTTTLITELRQRVSVPLVGVEPMVKPAAAATKSGVIAVCATPATLASQRYATLKHDYAANITVLEPDCSDWALMIQGQNIERDKISQRINEVLNDGADVIVLACTHYHWIEQEIVELAADRAIVLQPEQAIIEQLKRVIARLQ